jgi:transposase InsO family protein
MASDTRFLTVPDQLATGRKIRVLTIVDTYSRFSPAIDARFSYRGEDVVQTLERVCKIVGYPKAIRVDQGSEFISRDLGLWAYQRDVVLDFSRPGKPTDNSFIESFNGKLRAEFESELLSYPYGQTDDIVDSIALALTVGGSGYDSTMSWV